MGGTTCFGSRCTHFCATCNFVRFIHNLDRSKKETSCTLFFNKVVHFFKLNLHFFWCSQMLPRLIKPHLFDERPVTRFPWIPSLRFPALGRNRNFLALLQKNFSLQARMSLLSRTRAARSHRSQSWWADSLQRRKVWQLVPSTPDALWLREPESTPWWSIGWSSVSSPEESVFLFYAPNGLGFFWMYQQGGRFSRCFALSEDLFFQMSKFLALLDQVGLVGGL